MYRAYINNTLFFNTSDTDDELMLSEASVNFKQGTAGEFRFVLPPCNRIYGNIHRLIDYITVYRDNNPIFSGRVYSITQTLDTQLKVVCEGLLAVLNDSIFRPEEYQGELHGLVRKIIGKHNEQVEEAKQLTVGRLLVSNTDVYRAYQNYESSISRLQDLVESFGGWMRVRRENDTNYFDWYNANIDGTTQRIDFGENLLDIKQEINADGICTVLIPLGATDSSGKRIDITSVNGGLDYIEASNEYIQQYGYIVASQIWDDVHFSNILKTKAIQYINACVTPRKTIEVKAVDLKDTGVAVDNFTVGQKIRVTSKPHGIENEWFDCTSQSLDLLHPAQNKLVLGSEKIGFIKAARSQSAEVRASIERIAATYAPMSILDESIERATALITGNSGGHIVLHDSDGDGEPDELLVMDTPDIETAVKVWRFNNSGLGYSSTGYDGTYGLAMTMDGQIVADFITTGTLSGDRIKTGRIEARNGGTWWDLDTGQFYLTGDFEVDKSKVFIHEPTTPYFVGDLWVTGYNRYTSIVNYAIPNYATPNEIGTSDGLGVIMYCIASKESGNFDSNDWKVVTNYIDTEAIATLNNRVYAAEQTIDAQQGQIEQKASSTEVSEMGLTITTLGNRIDAQDNTIEILGQQVQTVADKSKTFRSEPVPPYADGDTWVTGTESYSAIPNEAVPDDARPDWGGEIFVCIRSKAATAHFDEDDWVRATKYVDPAQLHGVRQEIKTAEIAIDAANARIDLKAETSTVTVLTTRVQTAEITLQSARVDIRAQQSITTDLTNRVQSAEISVDAQNGILLQVVDDTQIKSGTQVSGTKLVNFINISPDTTKIHAEHIDIEGAVSITDLDNALKAKVNSALKGTVICYYRSTGTTAPNRPTSPVTSTNADTSNAWVLVLPRPKSGCTFWSCEQNTTDNGTTWNAPKEIPNATYTSKWCNTTNSTYIDGSSIYTGTIAANRIQSDATFTQHLTAENIDITGGKITLNIDRYYDYTYMQIIYDQYYKSYFGLLWAGFHADTYRTYWGTEYNETTRLPTNQFIAFEYNYTTTHLRSWLSSSGLLIQNGTNANKSANLTNSALNIKLNGDNYKMSLDNYELTLQYGSTNRQSYLTYQSMRLTNGSKVVTAEVNNSVYPGSVVTADYLQAWKDCYYPNKDSDIRLKKDIAYIDKSKAANFVYNLKPLQYRLKNLPERIRHGFITKDVKPYIYDGWGIVHKKPDGYECLEYTEIIADIVATVQIQHEEIQALTEKIRVLEGNA